MQNIKGYNMKAVKGIETKEQAQAYLRDRNYGDKRDYRKIYVNGLATTWADTLKTASVAWFEKYGEWPSTVQFA